MKKRIVAAALAAVLVCGIIGLRPRASGAVVAIGSIGVAAYIVLMTMIQNSEAYDNILEAGIDNFVNSDSIYHRGWEVICDKLTSWVDDSTVSIDDSGKVKMNYQLYLELYDALAVVVAPTVDLGSSLDYALVSYPINTPVSFAACKKLDSFYYLDANDNIYHPMNYIPVYYTNDSIFFCYSYFGLSIDYYIFTSSTGNSLKLGRSLSAYNYDDSDYGVSLGGINFVPADRASSYSVDQFLADLNFSFYFDGKKCYIDSATDYDNFIQAGKGYGIVTDHKEVNVTKYLKYDGKTKSKVDPNSIPNDSSFGYMVIDGKFDKFINSLNSYESSPSTELDDLSNVLPLDKTTNPGLVIDTDPAIAVPSDAVTVTDVPGQADTTLTDLKADTRLDIDIPSVISTKFPFCIPYDLGVFCADPKAPVFRIPISTDPSQLDPFKGNQTIGDIPENFEPMFEIDEELVIDLSVIPLVQPICYTVFIVGFVLLLIHITPKMINH